MRSIHFSCIPLLWLLATSATLVQAQPPIRLITARSVMPPALAPVPARPTPWPVRGDRADSAAFLQGTVWARVAAHHGLDPVLLYSVALKETRHRAGVQVSAPWPFTLRGPQGSQFHPSRAAAAQALQRLMARHAPLAIDVGLMQINLRWHGDKVSDPAQLLDAQTNLEIAAAILVDAIHSAPGDLELGVGRYHHWKHDTIARAYGRSVLNMVRSLSAGS